VRDRLDLGAFEETPQVFIPAGKEPMFFVAPTPPDWPGAAVQPPLLCTTFEEYKSLYKDAEVEGMME
jgi:hypothetical protein